MNRNSQLLKIEQKQKIYYKKKSLNIRFPNHRIGRVRPQLWATESLDLTSLDFVALGFIEFKM